MPPEDPESIPSLFPGGGDVPASRKDAAEPKPAAARRSRFARGLARRVGAGLPSPVRAGARALLGRRKDHSEQEQQQSSGAPEQTSSGPSSPDRTSRTIGGALRPQPDKASAPAAASSRVDPRSSAASKQRTSSRDSWAPTGGEPRAGASLASIPHTGHLPDLPGTPTYLLPPERHGELHEGRLSCGYCGVGDSGQVRGERRTEQNPAAPEDARTGGRVGVRSPTKGCVKLQVATGTQGTLFPIHLEPSIKDRYARERRAVSYTEAIARFADLCLDHRDPDTQILVYGCGQIDYFTIFAMQEVFRLLGVRNVAGNAEHCLNAGAVHNEMLTGQEGPFLTFDCAFDGPGRFFLVNGWNGLVTHPGAWHRMLAREGGFDGYVIDVMETESARRVARLLGEERVLLIRPGSDPHLALAVAHELLTRHRRSVEQRFIDSYSEHRTWRVFRDLARSERFAPEAVAERIAPEPRFAERILAGIRDIAARFADPETVPINVPSVGLSQTKGAVSHCLWGNTLAMLGKYGLKEDGSAAGGTLRVPGQINAESEVQALSRLFFFGRIPVDDPGAVEAARRMGLPDDSYELAVRDDPRPVLDYSISANEYDRELIIAFGTQFEANMMDRGRWLTKLKEPGTTLVVVDPVPDPFSLEHAHLVIPSPPHAAAPKLYQNGEWRFTLSVPRRQAAPETRSDATILYDTMAEISRRIRKDSMLRMIHPDLGFHSQSGYLRERFEDTADGGGLPRYDGEVSRAHLWQRVLDYCADGPDRTGPLYCRPEHADGSPILWGELLDEPSVVYGGVGSHRYRLAYDEPDHVPFRDIFERPGSFRFFDPTDEDLRIPVGTILNSGRSPMSESPSDMRFAITSFNSGKATPAKDMPEEHPLYISPQVAAAWGVSDGDLARVINEETGEHLEMTVSVNDRLVGDLTYVPFHKDRAQVVRGRYLNTITSQAGRCPYTAQSNFKLTGIRLEKVARSEVA